MHKTGLVFHKDFMKHYTGEHPEKPERLEWIDRCLQENKMAEHFTPLEFSEAGMEQLLAVHYKDYISEVEGMSRSGGGYLDPDTPVSPDSYRVARMASGGCMAAASAVIEKKVRNALCLIRPPGHHARKGTGMGFCLFNNAAVTARAMQAKYGLKKVLIIDWDVHHGNGTQEIFYDDPAVFYFSTHLYPFYPGTGSPEETGRGDAEGTTLNVPFSHGADEDEFKVAFKKKLFPAAEKFKPELVIISAGFDSHREDPLGGLGLTCQSFYELTRMVMEFADTVCEGRVLSVLEGGYHPKFLPLCVLAHADALTGSKQKTVYKDI